MDCYESRFFTRDDFKKDSFAIELLPAWWSRPYEYAWAEKFANENDIVLDAACGIAYPFKFHLSDLCREVYACDFDGNILSQGAILQGIEDTFGKTCADGMPRRYLSDIRYERASLTSLPHEDLMFDRIFCISVLEHLKDRCNAYPFLLAIPFLRNLLRRDIFLSLREFKRTLKDDGLIVLTFDYPDINLGYLKDMIHDAGLTFVGKSFYHIPENALYNDELQLYCYRAVLKKRHNPNVSAHDPAGVIQ